MRSLVSLVLTVIVVSPIHLGCAKKPDPKANPNFNQESLMNPGAVKMGPDVPMPPAPQQQ